MKTKYNLLMIVISNIFNIRYSFHLTLRQTLYAVKNLYYATCYSFIKQGNMFQPRLMLQGVAALELMNDIICNCEDFCTGKCSSFENSEPCTAAYKCDREADLYMWIMFMLCTHSCKAVIASNDILILNLIEQLYFSWVNYCI